MLKIKVINRIPKFYDPENIDMKWKGRIYFDDPDNPWEDLYMESCTWTLDQYEQQWKEGLKRLKSHSSSCLIGSIAVTAIKANEIYVNMSIFYLYKFDKEIRIQHQGFYPQLTPDLMEDPLPFNPFDFNKRYDNLHLHPFLPDYEYYVVKL